MDCRVLNLPWTPKGTGEAPAGKPGLWVDAAPGMKGAGNGKPGIAWLLDAEEVGIGGENGSGGYWAEGMRDGCDDIEGAASGSSPPNETPRALSLASCNSLT